MTEHDYFRILNDTSYVHSSGTDAEKRCAAYLKERCLAYTPDVAIEEFPVEITEYRSARLLADGQEIECRPYMGFNGIEAELPLYFLEAKDSLSYERCKGRAVLTTGYPVFFDYQDIANAGAECIICYTGDVYSQDKELVPRSYYFNRESGCPVVPSLLIRSRDALSMLKNGVRTVSVRVDQTVKQGISQNVAASLPGLTDEYIVCTAHYDSTPLSHGSYDNMTGCIALLNILETMSRREPGRYGIKCVFTGSEETGADGALAYCAAHGARLAKCVLNINMDMLGAVGELEAVCTSDGKLAELTGKLCRESGSGIHAHTGVYSGDSTAFAGCGIPSVSFTRFTVYNHHIAPFHSENDTPATVIRRLLEKDVTAITAFTIAMAEGKAAEFPREIPAGILEQIEVECGRKRPEK